MRTIATLCFAAAASVASASFELPPVSGVLQAQTASAFSNKEAAALFNIDHVPEFAFTMPEDRWKWLQAHAVDEEEERAEVRFDGQPAGIVGLRFKGSVGSLERCVDKSTGALKCPKLSMKMNVAKFDTANRFFGLKKVNFHSMVGDPTKLHERLAYDLLNASGIKAPRSAWAKVTVNGKSYGLFAMVEEIDDVFVGNRWPGDGTGNLFKETWPTTTKPEDFAKALHTNKDTGSTEAIIAFAAEMSTPSGDAAATLSKWTDPAYLARYMAVDDALQNCDGVTALYTGNNTGPAHRNHNFYLYQEPDRNMFWLIPWDMGQTFGGCDTFKNVPRWTTAATDCSKVYTVWDGGGWVHAPGCDRMLQAIATRRADYNAAVDQLLSGPFSEATLLEKIDRWSKFIHDAAAADPTFSVTEWTEAVQELRKSVPALRNRLKGFRDSGSER